MDAKTFKTIAEGAFGGMGKEVKVVHGKFLIGAHNNRMQVVCGVGQGDDLTEGEYEGAACSVVIVVHRRGEIPQNVSPEDFLANPNIF